MTNNIDSLTNQYLQISGRPSQAGGTDKSADAAVTDSQAKTASKNADTVELTEDARLMQAVEERLTQVNEVDSSRVEAIRNQIESGEYTVSAERTADKMMAFDRSLPENN